MNMKCICDCVIWDLYNDPIIIKVDEVVNVLKVISSKKSIGSWDRTITNYEKSYAIISYNMFEYFIDITTLNFAFIKIETKV